jgi:hypothetical protein
VTHCLLHVSDNIEQLQGNLDAIAAWPFESLARILKPFLRTGFKPVNQLNNRLLERFVHHVPTFMDVIHQYGNRMKYVMGDISAPSKSQQQKQQKIGQADLEKTALEYAKHMRIVSVQEAKDTVSVSMAAAKNPLRMYLGRGRRAQPGTPVQTSKRLTYDTFELGNEFPNNCALIIDTRKWRQNREIKYEVIIVHDIFAAKTDSEDKKELQTLKEIQEHIRKSSSRSSNNQQQHPTGLAALPTSPAVLGGGRATRDNGDPEILFHISGSKFEQREPFTQYPLDSSKNHVYKVKKPHPRRTHFLANQVCAKMIALPMIFGKPYNIAQDPTSSHAFKDQIWHVAPLLHGLFLSHTKMESSFGANQSAE